MVAIARWDSDEPDEYPLPPRLGAVLFAELKHRKMSHQTLANLLGMQRNNLSAFLASDPRLSVNRALDLEAILTIPADKLLRIDVAYQLAKARQTRAKVEAIDP